MWMVYSLGTRQTWLGSFSRYLSMEDALSAQNGRLRQMDGCSGMLSNFFIVSEPYQKEVYNTIEDILEGDMLNSAMQSEFLALREVYRYGPVLMG